MLFVSDGITLNMQMRYRILTLYNLFKKKLVCLLMSCVKRKKNVWLLVITFFFFFFFEFYEITVVTLQQRNKKRSLFCTSLCAAVLLTGELLTWGRQMQSQTLAKGWWSGAWRGGGVRVLGWRPQPIPVPSQMCPRRSLGYFPPLIPFPSPGSSWDRQQKWLGKD